MTHKMFVIFRETFPRKKKGWKISTSGDSGTEAVPQSETEYEKQEKRRFVLLSDLRVISNLWKITLRR